MISPEVLSQTATLQERFQSARPFRHLMIDNFIDHGFCQRLLADFPKFENRYAINEFGEVGKKAVIPGLASISSSYRDLYSYINSQTFLEQISALTGIENLIPDPLMYGGGTHENREGQNLDAHVDFNYSQDRTLHRRLNLLLYLNTEWSEDWGGCIELHSNPRAPQENKTQAYLPLFNRAVIFETNEHSWHGFKTITLPTDKKHLSRKCISIYLYTKTRPEAEIVPEHGTFYVQDPLPDSFTAGHTLTPQDVSLLQSLLKDRDDFIQFYQRMELEKNRTIAEVNAHLDSVKQAIRLPLAGYVRQKGPATGFWHDNWISDRFIATLEPDKPVHGITLHGYFPPGLNCRLSSDISCAGSRQSITYPEGKFSLNLDLPGPLSEPFELSLITDSGQATAAAIEPGGRALVFLLQSIEFHHSRAGIVSATISRLRRRKK